MIAKKFSFISFDKELKPERFFKPGDVWVSMLELGTASFCISRPDFPTQTIAASIINLAHLIECIVLSDRLCWESKKELPPGPLVYVPLQIKRHMKVACIDEFHPFTEDSVLSLDDYFKIIQPEICQAIIKAAHNMFAVPKLKFDDETKRAFLRDYLLATKIIPSRYSPNPFYCQEIIRTKVESSLLEKGTNGKRSSQILLDVVRDLRNEVAKEYNTMREIDIYDINIPTIFSAVLKESKDADDIFRVAKQMRKEASKFRAWCRELDESDDPQKFVQSINDAEAALKRLGEIIREKRDVRLTILKIQIPTVPSTRTEKTFRKVEVEMEMRKPVAFLHNLYSLSRKVRELDSEIARIFPKADDTTTQIRQVLTNIIEN